MPQTTNTLCRAIAANQTKHSKEKKTKEREGPRGMDFVGPRKQRRGTKPNAICSEHDTTNTQALLSCLRPDGHFKNLRRRGNQRFWFVETNRRMNSALDLFLGLSRHSYSFLIPLPLHSALPTHPTRPASLAWYSLCKAESILGARFAICQGSAIKS